MSKSYVKVSLKLWYGTTHVDMYVTEYTICLFYTYKICTHIYIYITYQAAS